MAIDPNQDAAFALHRFGLGPRVGTIAAISSDPRGALLAELDRPNAGGLVDPDLMTSGDAARALFEFQRERKAARLARRDASQSERQLQGPAGTPMQPSTLSQNTSDAAASNAPPDASMPTPTTSAPPGSPAAQPVRNAPPGVPQRLYLQEAHACLQAGLGADIGFVERLVWFWSNHFCVSADKGAAVRTLCGAFEREAIRKNVLGRFGDLLLAVESHPAMLHYLDNVRSFGPGSIAGVNRGAGLNENLAREILELHTLGVRTVYTQSDVTSFAKVITGWSVVPFRQDPVHGGEFAFNPRTHEPGAQTVIGKTYSDNGLDQGRAVLADLARHPATAQHIAVKFATHFVADKPPSALVARLTKRFVDTDGDLKELAKSLVTSEESWQTPRDKLKRPREWTLGALRAIGMPAEIQPIIQAQNMLGEPLWRPPAPKGFSDDSAEWLSGIAERLDVANLLAGRYGLLVEPDAVIDIALGPLATDETRQTVKRAESRPQALALLLMAPEFQRR
ncbi:MAG: DUF1800 family protein [Bradyrhizobiaceae bacterium]|nr:DUF1800 family protein [Bradyrhizobiaceae bacterium]